MGAFSPFRILIIVAFLAVSAFATQAQPIWIGSLSGSGYLYSTTGWGNAVGLSNNVTGIPSDQFRWTRGNAIAGFYPITNVATTNCLTADPSLVVEKPCTGGDDQKWQVLTVTVNFPKWAPVPDYAKQVRLLQNKANSSCMSSLAWRLWPIVVWTPARTLVLWVGHPSW